MVTHARRTASSFSYVRCVGVTICPCESMQEILALTHKHKCDPVMYVCCVAWPQVDHTVLCTSPSPSTASPPGTIILFTNKHAIHHAAAIRVWETAVGRWKEREGGWQREGALRASQASPSPHARTSGLRPQSRRASTPWRGPVSSGGPHLQRPWSPPQSRLSQHPRCVTNHQRHARMNELKVDGVGMRCCKVGNSCF